MDFNFSANTGYLWKEHTFFDRIKLAKKYRFQSIEFHDEPHFEDLGILKKLLSDIALPVNSMNVRMGKSFGCAAIPDRISDAQKDISEAIRIAEEIGAKALHVLAGITEQNTESLNTFIINLKYAINNSQLMIVIEPVCEEQLPGYFLNNLAQAAQVLNAIRNPRLKILFDCYHVLKQSGDLVGNFTTFADQIGHVQIAAAEARGEPFPGELDYTMLLPKFQSLGYIGPFGCEYRPKNTTEAGLSWRDKFMRPGN